MLFVNARAQKREPNRIVCITANMRPIFYLCLSLTSYLAASCSSALCFFSVTSSFVNQKHCSWFWCACKIVQLWNRISLTESLLCSLARAHRINKWNDTIFECHFYITSHLHEQKIEATRKNCASNVHCDHIIVLWIECNLVKILIFWKQSRQKIKCREKPFSARIQSVQSKMMLN